MSELLLLGTSAGVSTANRHHFSIAVKKDGRLYLFDCGCPAGMLLKRMGEDPRDIEAVFLTHWHPDHASGLPMLLQDLQLTGRRADLPILGPPGTVRKVGQLQTIFIIPPEAYPYKLTACDYAEGTVYDEHGIRVECFRTKHLAQENWKQLDERHGRQIEPVAYGFVIHIDGKKIVLSGDILTSADLIPYLSGADLVIHEFGHIDPEKLKAFAKEQQIGSLLITHIHHEWDLRSEELKRIVSAGHTGDVQVADDLMRITL